MRIYLMEILGMALLFSATNINAQDAVPEPRSWKFPDVIESARAISPKNVAGVPFNQFGMAYSKQELAKLNLASLSANELQKYADIVTHAYPDAVAKRLPSACDNIDVKQLNETAIAGFAYISIHALNEKTRKLAASCLKTIQGKLK